MTSPAADPPPQARPEVWGVLLVFLRLGLTSFGGPMAHLAFFRDEFVLRRRWLTDAAYADLVALCQFLPGPASSQVGMAIGLQRGGYAGALAAWLGFTLPSAVLLVLLALGLTTDRGPAMAGALHGLKVVTVAVVAHAVWGMARAFCTDAWRIGLTAASVGALLWWPVAGAQIGVIVVAGVLGLLCLRVPPAYAHDALPVPLSRRAGTVWLAVFVVLLLGLPWWAAVTASPELDRFDAFYRAGAMVFGGGHVVLPLLQASVVPNGWVDEATFLAGYAAAQAVPGPLFTFAGFLGAAMAGPWGGVLALLAIFLPSFLLVAGSLPFWAGLRGSARARAALSGVNAAVVGLLLAALYQPVWTGAILRPTDAAFALLAWAGLAVWKWPPWAVVGAGAAIGWGVVAPF
jgi:chromate transporter